MRKSAGKAADKSIRSSEHLCGQKFGVVAKAIWPEKTAFELSALTGASLRACEYWLAGQRHPNAAAIRAVLNEILS
jgi:hypothetical protein